MSERAKIPAKTPEAKRKHAISRKQKTTYSQSMSSPVDRILFLQRTVGNQAVQRMMKTRALQVKLRNSISCPVFPRRCPFGGACHTCPVRVQAKLKIGQPNDKYEQEADRVADQVMRMPEPRVQRQIEEEEEEPIRTKPLAARITPLLQRQAEPEEEEEEEIQTKPLAEQITPLVQRQAEEEEEKESLQTKHNFNQTAEITSDLETRIQSVKNSGQPLPKATRAFFEPRFGVDFSQVQVHTDARAAKLAQAANARAFTFGKNVIFGAGQYAPESDYGKNLLAHELTHVIQQGRRRGGENKGTYQNGMLKQKPLQVDAKYLAPNVQKESRRQSRFIIAIFVDLTNQTVSWIYANGMVSQTYECSTGAGLCNSDCSSPNRGGSACTPVGGPFRVCRKRPRGHGHPHWVYFNCARGIAFHHHSNVDGCPWSHGCVRLHSEAARLIYEGSRVNLTLVYVNGIPNLRRCWTSSTGGRCWVRGTRRTRRCRRHDCFPRGDFPIPDMSERYA